MKIAIIGGDMRFVSLARQLAAAGYEVSAAGFEKIAPDLVDFTSEPLEEAVISADAVVLPLPVTSDDIFLNAPFSDTLYGIETIMKAVSGKRVFCGKATKKLKELADAEKIKMEDYFEREELQVLNAIPTAEGAIEIIMAELPVTIWGLKVLICGYGRIGKYLSKTMAALGSEVTVAARKHSDAAWVMANGMIPTDYESLASCIGEFDVIFNTVPGCVLGKALLAEMKQDTLIVDLASKPGGVDLLAAGEFGRKVIWALSLPGKVAPVTAGKIIAETILNMLAEVKPNGFAH